MAEENNTPNPHKLLTREVVQNAIKKDLGSEWTLKDFEIIDFTQRGDNYASAVTSVTCKSVKNGNKAETFYVVKLNPLRQIKMWEDMITEIFEREGGFLTDVAIKLNSILRDIGYAEIRFPECFFFDFTKGKEVLLSRDLRKRGFKMFDRRLGMDPNHCILVVKELAKLHGSSIILKKRLQGKKILDLYPYMWDKWLDEENPNAATFSTMMDGILDNTINLLKDVKGYEKQTQSLRSMKGNFTKVYVDLIKNSPDYMKVICHGDCWNNNIVFRYDDEGKPIEPTLLDLQICRYGSIGLDLNYFFYTSLNGDVRKKYYDELLSVYFEELENVMKTAGVQMPFSEQEFRQEVRDKTLFGIMSGMMIVPMVVCEGEDIPDINKGTDDNMDELMEEFTKTIVKLSETSAVFKSRFLAIFDDMDTNGIKVSENDNTPNPHQLLTREVVQNAVKKDLGLDWTLEDFEIKDFTQRGDNYACFVTSVACKSVLDGKTIETSYVAKLNPLRQMKMMDDMMSEIFEREGGFLTDVAIKLNTILRDINYAEIKFPECFFFDFTKGKEVLLSRDLRKRGFKMFDRRLGMDPNHCFLIVKELAKLHGSSIILKKRLQGKKILDLYPYMWDKWLRDDSTSEEMMRKFMDSITDNAIAMIKEVEGYERQTQWITDLKGKFLDVYTELIKNTPDHLNVICHGDCWNNNVLFRYDSEGNPVEPTLLDLQLCRYASLGLDLNYFFYTSLNGDVRTKYYDQFLTVYFEELESVFKAAGVELPFTEEEVRKEVLDKTLFGILSGLMVVPIVVCEGEDIPDFAKCTDDNMEEFMQEFKESILKLSKTSEVFRFRFLSVFDDVIEKGILEK